MFSKVQVREVQVKTKTAIFKSPACGFLHFHLFETEIIMKLCPGPLISCARSRSQWPKKKHKGILSDGATRNEKVFPVSRLAVTTTANHFLGKATVKSGIDRVNVRAFPSGMDATEQLAQHAFGKNNRRLVDKPPSVTVAATLPVNNVLIPRIVNISLFIPTRNEIILSNST